MVSDTEQGSDAGTTEAPASAGARRSRALLGGAVSVLLLVLVLLGAAATGEWTRRPGTTQDYPTQTIENTLFPTMPTASLDPLDPLAPTEGGTGQDVLRWVLIIVGSLAAAVLVILVIKLLLPWMQRRGLPVPSTRQASAVAPEDTEAVDAPAMRDGIAKAQEILDSDREPSDAIIEAWLALEHAAASAGVGRRPAQTPTEFTAVVLQRAPVDHDAVDLLRTLYERVRFSHATLRPSDGESARDALTTIARSWSAVEVST